MSWDVWISKYDKVYQSFEDITKDTKPLCLGKRKEIQKIISMIFSGTDWRDPVWGIWESPDGSIEFNIGKKRNIFLLTLHVRANDSVVPLIIKLVQQNGWQALDGSDGLFLEQKDHPEKNLRKWRDFRDKIINQYGI